MKVEKIKFNDHKIFNDLEIDFKNKDGEIQDIIVIIGENGSGKTTLLKCIYDSFNIQEKDYEQITDTNIELTPALYTTSIKLEENEVGMLDPDIVFETGELSSEPKVVYMPAEINFEKVNKVDNTFNFTPYFQNIVDQNITQNIPSLIATKINKEIFKNRNKTIGEVIDSKYGTL